MQQIKVTPFKTAINMRWVAKSDLLANISIRKAFLETKLISFQKPSINMVTINYASNSTFSYLSEIWFKALQSIVHSKEKTYAKNWQNNFTLEYPKIKIKILWIKIKNNLGYSHLSFQYTLLESLDLYFYSYVLVGVSYLRKYLE